MKITALIVAKPKQFSALFFEADFSGPRLGMLFDQCFMFHQKKLNH
jgi:hypothetical protein